MRSDIGSERVNIIQFYFSVSYTGPRILLYTFLSKMFICFLSVFITEVSDAYVNVLSVIMFELVH
jgi:hypothetical protein